MIVLSPLKIKVHYLLQTETISVKLLRKIFFVTRTIEILQI